MRPASLAAAVAVVLGSTSALAAPPTTPSDLRVDVYSGTAAELFWGRSTDPDGAVSHYEIRRDGQLVDTRDGLSYFTDDLSDGRAFAFTVTAVDFDGERSAPAAVSVVGGDRGGAVGSGGGRPTPPANLTSSVYSSSAAEVFWDRSGQQGLSYEVSVDGGQVVTTDGTSAFLSGLDGARGRGVDVVAIDANGQRSGAANVTLGGGSGGSNPNPASGNGNGDAPAAPSNLRGDLYSSSAGEVFWDRVSGTRLEYEVSLGGEVVTTTTGTSYFVGNRPGLDGTSVEVVAIGPDGARSGASSTTLGGGGTSNPAPEPTPGTDAPPAPTNARIDVYSGTAAELFFDRAPSSANVVETEISRDGMLIGSTNGTSFFDDTRTPGTEYRYELVSIDRDGSRSEPSAVGAADAAPDGPDVPDGPKSMFLPTALTTPLLARIEPGTALSVANYETFLPAFYAIANPELPTNILRQTDRIQSELEAALAGAESPFVARSIATAQDGADDVTFACPDGGEVRALLVGADVPATGSTMDFRRCTVGSDTLSGVTREIRLPSRTGFEPDRGFGGYSPGFSRFVPYPFLSEVTGFGADDERFTVETDTGLSASLYAVGRLETDSFEQATFLADERWRGNIRLEAPDATLLVTGLYADVSRYPEDPERGDRIKPYFFIEGTVTNDRRVETINQTTFVGGPSYSFTTGGTQVFADVQGGVLDIFKVYDPEPAQFFIRIDAEGGILRQPIPADLDPVRALFDR